MTEWQAFQQVAYIIFVPVMPWAFGLAVAEIIFLFVMDTFGGLLSEYIKN
jgi:hypothetical protein